MRGCEVASAPAAVTPAPTAKKARLDDAATVSPPGCASFQCASAALQSHELCSTTTLYRVPARRVQPIEALNPYQSAWTIRVRAAGKGALRTVKTARGEVSVFSVELTDEQVCRMRRDAFARRSR